MNKNSGKTLENETNLSAASNTNCTFESSSLKLIAESIGIFNLADEACRDLASDLTFTLKSILIVSRK